MSHYDGVKIIACIEDPSVIKKILKHLEQRTESAKTSPNRASAKPLGRILTSSYADRTDAGTARCIANAPLVPIQRNILQTPPFLVPTRTSQTK